MIFFRPDQTNSRKNVEAGNIFLMLFATIAMVGILGAAMMTLMKGPVRSMSQVTQRTIAENNMIAAGKIALIAAANNPTADCDTDGTVEPYEYDSPIAGLAGGGTMPSNIGAAKQDPWGSDYGYCVWDHGAAIDAPGCGGTAQTRLQGTNATDQYVIAIVSAGPNRIFQTSCDDFVAPGTPILNKVSGADDITLGYTYAEAASIAGGLWIDDGSGGATIDRDISVDDGSGNTLDYTASSGTLAVSGSIHTDSLSSINGTDPIAVGSPLSSSLSLSAGATTLDSLSITNVTDAYGGLDMNNTAIGNAVSMDVGNDVDGKLTITSNSSGISSANGNGEGFIVLQNNSVNVAGIKMRIDSRGMQASLNNSGSTLRLNTFGGDVAIGNAGNANLDMNSGLIQNLANPGSAQDAATKSYVDTAVSDKRLKKDIHLMTDYGLETIMALRPVTYEWIKPTDIVQQGKQFGFIAQEVGDVVPELIVVQSDEMKTVTYKHRELTSILTKAVQELKMLFDGVSDKIATLFDRIGALEKENATLRQDVEELKIENQAIKERLEALEVQNKTKE